jgi:FKBP12-rapamycin complex-associated protein
VILSLNDFMERDDKRLGLDLGVLAKLAESTYSYPKALHYRELQFRISPVSAIESLISVNNHLHQPEASVGILTYARKNLTLNKSGSTAVYLKPR